MSWHFSRALAEEYSAGNSSAGGACAPLNVMPSPQPFWHNDRTMVAWSRSRSGTTCGIAFFTGWCKVDAWIKNTDMAKRATASSAESYSRQETKEANRGAARMLAVAFFKHGKPQGRARSALKSLSHRALAMRHAQEHAVQRCGFHEGRLTQWLMSGRGLPFSPVRSSQDVSETKQIERQCYLATRLKSFAPTLSRTSSLVCRGTTTGKGLTNGA